MLFQPQHGVCVQMVGGLVQQEDVRFSGQQSCQSQTGALSAAEGCDRLVHGGAVKGGNVSRILVKKEDEVLINIPLNVGLLGTVVAPWGMIAGVVAAFGFKCTIEFVKTDGSVVDLTDKAVGYYEDAKEKGTEMYADLKEKAPGFYEDAKEKAGEAFEKAKDAAEDLKDKLKKEVDDLDIECINLCDKDCAECEEPCEDRCDDCKFDECHPVEDKDEE